MFWRNKSARNKISNQYFSEEILNVVTHLTTLLIFTFLSGIMLSHTRHFWTDFIYCFFTVNLYASSMMYHYFEKIKLKKILRILDHSSINFLIAATYTPFMIHLKEYSVLCIIWTLAMVNVFEMIYSKSVQSSFLIKYVILGWMIIVVAGKLFTQLNETSLYFLFGGGLAYMIGVYFFLKDHTHKYYHTIWHVFTSIGTILHFFSVYNIP